MPQSRDPAAVPYPPDLADRPTVAIETHGCKLNQADSGVLESQFTQAGFRIVAENEPAGVHLVNTCTVTHIADRKARQALRAARRRNPNGTIVATGCYAQRASTELNGLAEVDLVVGNSDKPSLVKQVVEWKGETVGPCALGTEPPIPSPPITRTRAMIKIQEGCDQVCAYCIVPKVRGRERSIPPEEILQRIKTHVAQGYKEVVLTGTQLGTYGFDLPDISLTGLLERILRETDLLRLRVSSLQPQEIDAGMLRLWSDPRLCPHFHLALQSGSDAVLKRMRRRYTARQYVDSVQMIRDAVPGVSITADVIVGFPGETEDDFEQTYGLCDEVGFAAMHVFPYSVRPGTSAAHFTEQVDPMTKSRRVQGLLSLSQRYSAAFRKRFLGTTRSVLWESPKVRNRPSDWTGLTDNYIRVVADSSKPLAGEITPARLLKQAENLVVAQVLR